MTVATRRSLAGPGLAAAAGLLLASVVITGKPALEGNAPFTILALRFSGTAIVLALVALATRVPLRPVGTEWRGMFLAGLCGYGVESALFFSALNHGSAAAVALLFYTYPISTMLIAVATHRIAPGRALWAALGAATAGVTLLIGLGGSLALEPVGVALALTCALGYTLYMTVTDRVLVRSHPLSGAIWLAVGAATCNLALATVSGSFALPAGWPAWRPIVYMAIATAGAFTCVLGAIKRIGAVRTSIIAVTEPLAVAILGALRLGEPLTAGIVVGGALILTGGVLATLARGDHVVEPDV
jgi:drug/metabolite transporter (DMT)-like permease